MNAKHALTAVIALLLLPGVSACGPALPAQPSEPISAPNLDGDGNLFHEILGEISAPAGWGVEPCEGDAAALCVAESGTHLGGIELMIWPLERLPEFEALLAERGLEASSIDPRRREHRAEIISALRAHAASYYEDLEADRQPGYERTGLSFQPMDPQEAVMGTMPGILYGFSGVTADGDVQERWLTFAGFDGQALYLIGANYSDAPNAFRSASDLKTFEPYLLTIIAGLQLPHSAAIP